MSEEAQSQIVSALENQDGESPPKKALRIEAKTNGTAEFAYSLKLVGEADRDDDDTIFNFESFSVYLDPKSSANLDGATLDFEDRILRSGFKFDNPNKPEVPSIGSGERPDLKGKAAEKVQFLIDSELNPAVAAHGGHMSLVGIKEDKAYISFGGGCHGCGMVDVTLKQGVETRIRELVPEIGEVVDVTDHSTGENPFYN